MKKKLWLICFMAVALMLAGCSKTEEKAEVARGTWSGMTYTNNWLGLEIPFEETHIQMTDAQIAQMIGLSGDILKGDGVISAADFESVSNGVVYDLAVYFSDTQSNFMLEFENMEKTSKIVLNETQYAAALATQLKGVSAIKYEIGETTKVTIAGMEFTKLSAVANSVLYQDYYIKQYDNYMLAIITSYTDSSAAEMESLVNSIKAAK